MFLVDFNSCNPTSDRPDFDFTECSRVTHSEKQCRLWSFRVHGGYIILSWTGHLHNVSDFAIAIHLHLALDLNTSLLFHC